MKKIVLMIIMGLMMSAAADAQETDRGRGKRKKKHKTHQSSQHSWKSVSTRRTCNKKRKH